MRYSVCVMAVLTLICASAASGQVRVEIAAGDLASNSGPLEEASGFGVRSTLPPIEPGHELLVALMWVELSAEMADNEKGTEDRGCIAGVRIADGSLSWRDPALPEIEVPIGKTSTVCCDITVLVKEQIAAKASEFTVGIVPCNDEDGVVSVAARQDAEIVGWIEYSFCDVGKRARMLSK